ncbi:hemerythrin domain-containing protein [Pelomonas sp. BJYL3]|uniref:hemerythrin domain-containing protein n=1 Tax=Pelomonas sp. BJYL3 TaxID=2976697 RepID=UPI0022B4EF7C|nr:hemerythrin domain-containing protein [Pelomonas sp. BJYL3]
MPTPQSVSSRTARKSGRPASKARNELLTELKDDHQRVKKAYSKYRRLDAQEDAETRQELVQLILDELSVHARLEEELLYPAAKEELADCSQIDEAEVEHEMLHLLIGQLRELDPEDEAQEAQQQARFTVLCEYTLHHVKEEERDMFPQLMKAKLDWLGLARDFKARRAELKGESPDQGDPRGARGRQAGDGTGDDEEAMASSGEA